MSDLTIATATDRKRDANHRTQKKPSASVHVYEVQPHSESSEALPQIVLASPLQSVDKENAGTTSVAHVVERTYPEGGTPAYLVVVGSFCGCLVSLGLMNTISTYNAYLHTHQLSAMSASTVSWIIGLYAFLSFFLGMQIGPLFDAYGPRWLIGTGSICILVMYLLLAECRLFWHFILVFSVLGGTGTCLLFTPSVTAVGHWFCERRGTFTGIACVGGSFGGVVFPLMLEALLVNERIGWAWAQRIMALVNLPLLLIANLLIKARLPRTRSASLYDILPHPRIFRNRVFLLLTIAVFFMQWALFVPISYLISYALSIRIEKTLAYQLPAIYNASSCFGRWIPGLISDRTGRFNTMIWTTIVCSLSVLVLWLPSEQLDSSLYSIKLVLLILFNVVFGFGSGSSISLIPACIGQICPIEEYGRHYATCYTIVSFAISTSVPIAGALSDVAGAQRYWPVIIFTALTSLVSLTIFVLCKGVKVGFGKELWTVKF